MRAVAVTRPGHLEIVDLPMPTIHEYECLVKVLATGFCNSTDMKIIDNHISNLTVKYPVILGHEGVGEIIEVGAKVKNYRVGDAVISPFGRIEPGTPYTAMWGGMVEYAIVQDKAVMHELGIDGPMVDTESCPIPRGIAPTDAAVILTLKENMSAIRNFGFRPGMDVLVYGDGPVGLGIVNFLRLSGAGWIGCVGHHQQRLAKIAAGGSADQIVNSHTDEVPTSIGARKLDMVIDAVGSVEIIREATRLLKPGGRVGVYGVIPNDRSVMSLLDLQNNTSVHMLNFPFGEHAVTDEVVDLARDGKIRFTDYYSHTLPLEEIHQAVNLIRSREAYKVVLTL